VNKYLRKIILFLLSILLLQTANIFSLDEPPEGTLFFQTLAKDIDTADFYELASWCRRIGLEDTGSLDALKSRLYRYYGLQRETVGSTVPTKRIKIPQAGSTEYFTIEEVNEDYLLMQGNVIIELIDLKEDVYHRIKAQRILVNRTRQMLSADGNVEYLLQRGDGKPEIFTSESFSFDLKTWAGVFVEGRGETVREIEENEPVSYYFAGQTISRLDSDVVLLDEGSVTSCDDQEDPHWHIAASKIYVLAPGEWAIRDAVLFVGRVPLLYIPFFFKPGDEFFFHPAIGYRNREGWFIQTTTYLYGTPEKKESALSFLRVSEKDSEILEREIEGLFLRTVRPEEGTEAKKKSDTHVLKILLDVYSRLGGFAGVVADHSPLWRFKGGLGVSRSIFPLAGSSYYSQFAEGDLTSHWNSSVLFGLNLPFRYGINTNLNLGSGGKTISGHFELYSDPFFPEDFYSRSEKINWTSLLQGQQGAGLLSTGAASWDLYPETKDSFTWQMRSRLVFPFDTTYLREFTFQRFDIDLYWQSKYIPDYSDPLLAVDPNRKFFYPSRLILPNAQIRLKGELLKLPAVSQSEKTKEDTGWKDEYEPGRGFRLPSSEEKEEAPLPEEDQEDFVVPPPRGDVEKASGRFIPSFFTLSYEILPKFLLENQFNHPGWSTADDVDWGSKYTSIDMSFLFKLHSGFAFWGGILRGVEDISFNGIYSSSFNRSSDVPQTEWDDLLEGNYQKSGVDINNALSLSVFPFLGLPKFALSKLQYDFVWDVYRYYYSVTGKIFSGGSFEWDKETVLRHQVANSIIYSTGGVPHSLNISAVLPPLDMIYRGDVDFTLGCLRSKVKGGVVMEEFDPLVVKKYDPLVVTESLGILPWFMFAGELSFDLNAQAFDQAETKLKLFKLYPDKTEYLLEQELVFAPENQPLYRSRSTLVWKGWGASFLAEKQLPLTLNKSNGVWETVGVTEKFLPIQFYIGYTSDALPAYFWKDRVRLETALNTSVTMDFQRFTQSSLAFSWDTSLSIHRFLDFSISINSHNRKLYLYFPAYAEYVSGPGSWVNPLEDLLRSFNFFNINDREYSSFNLKSVSIKAVHQLHDWNLTFDFSVQQVLQTDSVVGDYYEWMPIFTLLLKWQGIPEMKRSIRRDAQGINLRG
jgi:hypothetical protein